MRQVAILVALGALGLSACVSDEKGGDFDALGAIREVFGTRIRGDGSPLEGAQVASVTRAGIEWVEDAGGPSRRLAWADLEDVEFQEHQEQPARPEALYLYLARGSASVDTAGAQRPPLSGAELVRCYVLLRDRPRGSRAKLVRALRTLGRAVKPPAPRAGVAPPTTATTTAEPAPLTTEQKLARLKALHDKGLITDEVYAEEQRKILSQGY